MGRPVVIDSYSEKGGVGKTSQASGLLAVAADRGMRVVGVDLDPRASLTRELGVNQDVPYTVNDLLYIDGKSKEPPVDPADAVGDVLAPAGKNWPATVRVLAAERALAHRETDSTMGMETRLARAIDGLDGEVDLIVIDKPPRAGGKLTAAGLTAATHVVIPATLTTDGVDGVEHALTTLALAMTPRGVNPNLVITGIVRSIVPRESDLREIHREFDRLLQERWKQILLPTVVRNYSIREECRYAATPITAAPGREARILTGNYGEILDAVLSNRGGAQ